MQNTRMKFAAFFPAFVFALFFLSVQISNAQPNLPTIIGNILGPGGVEFPISVTLLQLATPNNLTILNLTLPITIDNNQLLNVSVLVQLQTHSLSGITLYVEVKINGEIVIALPVSLDLTAIVGLLGPGIPIGGIVKPGRRFIGDSIIAHLLPYSD